MSRQNRFNPRRTSCPDLRNLPSHLSCSTDSDDTSPYNLVARNLFQSPESPINRIAVQPNVPLCPQCNFVAPDNGSHKQDTMHHPQTPDGASRPGSHRMDFSRKLATKLRGDTTHRMTPSPRCGKKSPPESRVNRGFKGDEEVLSFESMETTDNNSCHNVLSPNSPSHSNHHYHPSQPHHSHRLHQHQHHHHEDQNQLTVDSISKMSWLDFDQRADPSPMAHKIGKSVNKNCERFSIKESFFQCFPLFHIFRSGYTQKDLMADVVGGFTVGVLQIPQGIAYALLLGVSPVYGLYTSLFPAFIYSFIGTAQHISLGTMAAVEVMLADMASKHETGPVFPSLNHTMVTGEPVTRIEVVTSMCFIVGLIQLLFGILHLGSVSIILSDQLISGFSAGASLNVIINQIPSALEITGVSKGSGLFALVYQTIEIFQNLHSSNTTSLIVSSVVLIISVIYKGLVDPKLSKLIPFPFPMELLIVIGAIVASDLFGLNPNYDVKIMGDIPQGIPTHPVFPRTDIMPSLILDSVMVAVICFAISLSMGKIYGKQHGYTIRANQEFVAYGVANTVSSLFLCFPSTASLSRTASMGKLAKSQFSTFFSCIFVAFVLLFLAPFLETLPKVLTIKEVWKISRWEGLIMVVTFLSVVLLGIDIGLIAGIVFSIFSIIMRFYNPKLRRLGQLSDTDILMDVNQHRETHELTGVKIFQFSSPLFFLNKDVFRDSLIKKSIGGQKFHGNNECEYGAVHTVIIDCSAMSFIDSAGVNALVEVSNELNNKNIQVVMASCPHSVLSMFHRTKFFQKVPHIQMDPTVQDTVFRLTEVSNSRASIPLELPSSLGQNNRSGTMSPTSLESPFVFAVERVGTEHEDVVSPKEINDQEGDRHKV